MSTACCGPRSSPATSWSRMRAACTARPIAEHAIALMLALRRSLHVAAAGQATHRGRRTLAVARARLSATRVLVIGLGAIGARIARWRRAWVCTSPDCAVSRNARAGRRRRSSARSAPGAAAGRRRRPGAAAHRDHARALWRGGIPTDEPSAVLVTRARPPDR